MTATSTTPRAHRALPLLGKTPCTGRRAECQPDARSEGRPGPGTIRQRPTEGTIAMTENDDLGHALDAAAARLVAQGKTLPEIQAWMVDALACCPDAQARLVAALAVEEQL